MPRRKKQRAVKKAIEKRLKQEAIVINGLRMTNPEMFRRCGDKPCCQATSLSGQPCSRPAMTESTYFQTLRCCYLCWQHALANGVYVTYKLAKTLATSNMDWDTYCMHFPQECEEMLEKQLRAN